jgi:hypothetical protein
MQEVKESQEIIQARRAADIASKKSLFQQLSDQQDKKQEEYDKNTKLIFGMIQCTVRYLYVCMYACMYACMYVCMYVRMYVCWVLLLFVIYYLLFAAPPKCLEEEDVEYFTQVDERHKQFLESQKQMDDKQLEDFRKKSQSAQQSAHPLLKIPQKKDETQKKSAAPVIGKSRKLCSF